MGKSGRVRRPSRGSGPCGRPDAAGRESAGGRRGLHAAVMVMPTVSHPSGVRAGDRWRDMEYSALSERFIRFAGEAAGESPLYEVLAREVAEDHQILSLASRARPGQPVPNLLLAAVHDVLLAGADHPLRGFYPDLTPCPAPPRAIAAYLRDFCLQHATALTCRLQTRRVQTNEVQRAAYLYLVFGLIQEEMGLPLSLIEIGCSAGLLLLWDRFRYDYGTGAILGPADGRLTLRAELRGQPPTPPGRAARVAFRVGVDLNVLDVRDAGDLRWLRALVWPEASERRHALDTAVRAFEEHPPRLIEGDGVELLPALIDEVPPGTIPVVFHLHVANQMPASVRERLFEHIRSVGRRRPLVHLYNNVHPERGLYLDVVSSTGAVRRRLGLEDGHGRWFDWLPDRSVTL